MNTATRALFFAGALALTSCTTIERQRATIEQQAMSLTTPRIAVFMGQDDMTDFVSVSQPKAAPATAPAAGCFFGDYPSVAQVDEYIAAEYGMTLTITAEDIENAIYFGEDRLPITFRTVAYDDVGILAMTAFFVRTPEDGPTIPRTLDGNSGTSFDFVAADRNWGTRFLPDTPDKMHLVEKSAGYGPYGVDLFPSHMSMAWVVDGFGGAPTMQVTATDTDGQTVLWEELFLPERLCVGAP